MSNKHETQSNAFGSVVRQIDDIQKAHDVIEMVALGKFPELWVNPEQQLVFTALTELLCWILNHHPNAETFDKKFDGLLAQIDRLGYNLIKKEDSPGEDDFPDIIQ